MLIWLMKKIAYLVCAIIIGSVEYKEKREEKGMLHVCEFVSVVE